MMIPGNAVLPINFLVQKKIEQNSSVEFFVSARQALFAGLKEMDLTDRTIWLPAYNCNSVLYPIKELGVKYKFYEVNDVLEPDFSTIENNPNDLILIVHYFGIVQNVLEIKNECQRKGLEIIEDCAHFLPTKSTESGKMGLFSIFSLRKQLPVPDGGVLIMRNGELRQISKSKTTISLKKIVLMIAETVFFKIQVNFLKIKDKLRSKVGTTETFFNNVDFEKMNDASGLTKSIFRRQNIELIKQKRISNFNFLANLLKNNSGTKLLFENVNESSMPMALPILVNDQKKMKEYLRQKGIGVDSWPGDEISDEVDFDQFSITKKLSEQLLLLPIHQLLNKRHLIKIADKINHYES